MEENEDAFLVVAEAYCRYKAPAYYDDELIVRTHITELRKRSLRFGYEIVRASNGQIVAEGETGHVITDSRGRVRSFPEGYAQRLLAPPLIKSHHGTMVPSETAPERKFRNRSNTSYSTIFLPVTTLRLTVFLIQSPRFFCNFFQLRSFYFQSRCLHR